MARKPMQSRKSSKKPKKARSAALKSARRPAATASVTRTSGFAPTTPAVYYDRLTPARARKKPSVVMIHGGAHTGACWITTVDGRPGWAEIFARAGFPVVAPDWPGCGRSGAVPIAQLDAETVCRGLGALLAHIGGPIVLMTHSMSGAFGWRLVETHGALIAAVVAVAPGPPGNIQPEPKVLDRGPDWIEVQGVALKWRLPLNAPFAASQSFVVDKLIGGSTRFPRAVIAAYHASLRELAPRLIYQRQNVEGSQIKVNDPANFRAKPILVFTGTQDTDHPRAEDGRTADWLRAQGARVDYWFLSDLGIDGNGHMLMMEDNSDALAARVIGWIDKAVG